MFCRSQVHNPASNASTIAIRVPNTVIATSATSTPFKITRPLVTTWAVASSCWNALASSASCQRGNHKPGAATADFIGSAIARQPDCLGFRHPTVEQHGEHGRKRPLQPLLLPRNPPRRPIHKRQPLELEPADELRSADVNQRGQDEQQENQRFNANQPAGVGNG